MNAAPEASSKELPFRIPPKPRPAAERGADGPRPRPGQSEPIGDDADEEEESRPSTRD